MKKTWFEKEIETYQNDPTFITQGKILELTEAIVKAMKNAKLKQKHLAEKMGVTPSFISKVLSGDHNLTISTLTKFSIALDLDLEIKLIERKPTNRTSLTLLNSNQKICDGQNGQRR